ncbi:hypothetical protein ACGC1H_003832 [Rhizoctonia solani]|uniref:Uncharacterized protein n=1 Tax=Rhizoctonia solani TaxID=456999 RepID=A0A8H3GY66_9AGAM|nr:unnamed protein product [Rhizoctonia solani]
MSTRGYFVYRYKRRYYRRYIPHDAYPEYWGNNLAQLVPRDPYKREAWIHATAVMLEKAELKDAESEEVECMHEIDTEGLNALEFNLIIDFDWTFIGIDILIQWTYVIDLDNNVFTVNDSTHFKLDDMPPESIGLELFSSMMNTRVACYNWTRNPSRNYPDISLPSWTYGLDHFLMSTKHRANMKLSIRPFSPIASGISQPGLHSPSVRSLL